MADENEPVEGAESAGGKKKGKGLIIIIIALVVLLGGGAGGWFMFGNKAAKKPDAVQLLPPRYITFEPAFVVNFESQSMVRFLQVQVGVMTREPAIETMIKDNDPRVRNDLLMILSNQTFEAASTAEGKEELRKRCLESIRAIVLELKGDPKQVEALYFTSFVMQ